MVSDWTAFVNEMTGKTTLPVEVNYKFLASMKYVFGASMCSWISFGSKCTIPSYVMLRKLQLESPVDLLGDVRSISFVCM
jgi:hypothetical protein